jgi:thymidylate synthase (FAD)
VTLQTPISGVAVDKPPSSPAKFFSSLRAAVRRPTLFVYEVPFLIYSTSLYENRQVFPKIPILDHGYIQLIETWGSDERIIEAARMSTDKGFQGWGDARPCETCKGLGRVWDNGDMNECPVMECKKGIVGTWGDEKLLKYLYENQHNTPFEMGGMIIEVQAPIMVFREWHRHRTQSYNEMSARYIPLPDVNYIPTVDRCLMVNGTNKQAGRIKDADELTHESALEWMQSLDEVYTCAQQCYEDGLRRGIPKELARLPVPVGRYSRMRASTCLRNWLAFMTLRSPGNAQWEIRQFSLTLGEVLISSAFPRTWQLFAAPKK